MSRPYLSVHADIYHVGWSWLDIIEVKRCFDCFSHFLPFAGFWFVECECLA